MSKVIVAFFAGLVVSFLGLYAICEVMVTAGMEQIHADELRTAPSPVEYQAALDRRARPLVLFLSVVGAFIGATLSGLYVANVSARKNQPGPLVRWLADCAQAPHDQPLTPDEFERVRQSCLFVNLHRRSSAYFQGLVVGRLADTAPDLAAKVDRFSEPHLEVIRQEILGSSAMA